MFGAARRLAACRSTRVAKSRPIRAVSFSGFGNRSMWAQVPLTTISATRPSASTTDGTATTMNAKTATTSNRTARIRCRPFTRILSPRLDAADFGALITPTLGSILR